MVDRMVVVDTVQVFGVAVETVEAKFVQRVEQEEAEARDAQRQSAYVDEGKDLLFSQVSPADQEVTFEHSERFIPPPCQEDADLTID